MTEIHSRAENQRFRDCHSVPGEQGGRHGCLFEDDISIHLLDSEQFKLIEISKSF